MAARLFRLPRPESGEHAVRWYAHHDCASAKQLRVALDDVDVDLIEFPVGDAGRDMPLDTPFAVTAVGPCGVCGASLRAWFEWTGTRVFDVGGGLWTP